MSEEEPKPEAVKQLDAGPRVPVARRREATATYYLLEPHEDQQPIAAEFTHVNNMKSLSTLKPIFEI